jgi:hypothetical protein
MEEALEEVRRSGRLRIQEKVFAAPHDPLADLVSRFSAALLEKLRAAEQKYGRKDDWLDSNWEADCQRQLLEHVAKGDPRDVAVMNQLLHHEEMVEQARRCACRGSDDYCVCQNVPDRTTRLKRLHNAVGITSPLTRPQHSTGEK